MWQSFLECGSIHCFFMLIMLVCCVAILWVCPEHQAILLKETAVCLVIFSVLDISYYFLRVCLPVLNFKKENAYKLHLQLTLAKSGISPLSMPTF